MLKVEKVIRTFNLEVVNTDKADLNKEIMGQSIHRLGLELALDKSAQNDGNIVGWGTKESKYLMSISPEKRIEKIKTVLNESTPLIILSAGVTEEIIEAILKVANEYKTAVIETNSHLSEIVATVGWYISKALSHPESIHGSLVIVKGVGVMVIGKSGIGKSEAVLELVQRGATFVSDDTVIVKRIGNEFIGEPAPITKGFLEARGIGLIDIPKIYGYQSVADNATIDLVVELQPPEMLHDADRLGNMELKYNVLNGEIDMIQIPVENGRTPSALIEAGVSVHILKKHGYDSIDEIGKRGNFGNE